MCRQQLLHVCTCTLAQLTRTPCKASLPLTLLLNSTRFDVMLHRLHVQHLSQAGGGVNVHGLRVLDGAVGVVLLPPRSVVEVACTDCLPHLCAIACSSN